MSSLREQGKAIMVMMGVAIVAVLAMIVLDYFNGVIRSIPGLGNGSVTTSVNYTAQALVTAFIVAFGIVGSFASVTVLIIVVKVIVGVVRGLKS